MNSVNQNVFVYRLTDRAKQPVPGSFVKALKSKDVALVGWVAGEVAKWPPENSRPVLEAALESQKKAGTGKTAGVIAKTLAGIKSH